MSHLLSRIHPTQSLHMAQAKKLTTIPESEPLQKFADEMNYFTSYPVRTALVCPSHPETPQTIGFQCPVCEEKERNLKTPAKKTVKTPLKK